ncbi:MAG: fibronectin type III domain-containing protein [Acidimicrobiales bacterium]
MSDEEALAAGMQEKSVEFISGGAEIYRAAVGPAMVLCYGVMNTLPLSSTRGRALALVVALVGVGAALLAIPPGVRLAGASSPPAAVPGAAPTPGAVSVRDHGALGQGTGDDTAAFADAMATATTSGAVRVPNGPTGAPQGVVYVPSGTYRLLNLTFPSNLRMEVDAGAVLEQAGGRTARAPTEYSSPAPAVVLWDGPPANPLTNVSLVGVGTATGGVKSLAGPVAAGWSVDTDFTFNVDPQATNANNLVSGLLAMNVDGFLVANVFSVQNDSQPATAPTTDAGWWPSSRKAVLGLRARRDSLVDRSALYDPHNGTIANWYNVRSPRGFGPNQVNSGHNLTVTHVYSRGGTALRLETDASNQLRFGSEVRSVQADDIAGENCNRAVAFAPHFQVNSDVHVTNVRAAACYQGVVESIDGGIPPAKRGAFLESTVSGVSVTGGQGAQLPVLGSNGLWTSGTSSQAFARERQDTWAVTYAADSLACGGQLQWPSDPIRTTTGVFQPACTPTTAQPSVPSAPPIGPATIRLNQATVSFSPAVGDGGSPITSYTVTSSPGGMTVSGTTSPVLVPALTAGTTYTFRVHATNAVGDGAESSPSNAVTASTDPPPDAPAGLTATVMSSTSVQLAWAWTARAVSYTLSRSGAAGGPYTVIKSLTKRTFLDTRVKPGTTYYYVVQAVSASGVSTPSTSVSVTTPG